MKNCLVVFTMLNLSTVSFLPAQNSPWIEVDRGLFYSEFESPLKSISGDSKILIVRTDPEFYDLKLLCASQYKGENVSSTVKQWVVEYRLIAGINAGMFQKDFWTNVGYMKNFDHLNNSKINPTYFSVAAFNPKKGDIPRFEIFDIDETDITRVIDRYHTVIQNLRLIKYPGENRWSPQVKLWSEAALGLDMEGNILFIFSRSPYSMHDLNDVLLSLPIGLKRAQHLEGGPEASFYLKHQGIELERVGSYETGFCENETNTQFWPVPNVIGLVKTDK